jgi:hypothetical protein
MMNWGQITTLLPLLYIPAGAAVIGFSIGRLLRGRPHLGHHSARS